MASKRKRTDEFFDPNKSDPEDDTFDPVTTRERKSSKKPRRTKSSKSSRRRRARYGGSDIDDDEDALSDSQEEDSFGDGPSEEEEDDDAPVNAAGRRARKVTSKQANYAESSEEEDEISAASDDVEEEKPIRKTRIVNIKIPSKSMGTRRNTRATSEDADLVELSNSGRHAVASSHGSKSKSPEAFARGGRRSSRAMKGVKKPPEPIEEATQESSIKQLDDADEPDELSQDQEAFETKEEGDEDMAEAADQEEDDVEPATIQGDVPVDADDEEDDDVPVTRRTRAGRATAASEQPESDAAAVETGRARRLTRRSGRTKSAAEPSSDFEPAEESDEPMSAGADADKAALASPSPRGRGSRRSTRARSSRGGGSADEDVELDLDELDEEARELRQTSRSRRRQRARDSPPVLYEKKDRRRTKQINYYMPPLAAGVIEDDEAPEPAPTPNRSRRGRGAHSTLWERNLNATYGPFGGGGGAGALLNGPWGTGAAGGAADSDSSDDEMMHRSNAAGNVGMTPTSAAPGGLLPGAHGLNADGAGATPNVGKIKDRKALADADPLGVDMHVDFDKVGGLKGHIDQLKEMVQLPLLYPELFTKFHVTPPRGVLFHGPPGTGKTLLARALANSVGSGGRKISFYMRKGADALSKWVGEAEKQLRLLFEEARKTQPSIIFFDEIDGLAPVRSSKQEQIHASIVSTLLALMDGMDGRGQVIVIGATNRPDNIDPALRRPGRFDREFYFPLPDVEGRRSIIDIQTKDWGLADNFKDSLAEQTKGYGGADLRALSTEAALNSIQRTYPQIYASQEKLIVKPENIHVHASDFMMAIKRLIPSSERSATSGAKPLPQSIAPLLRQQLDEAKGALDGLLPRKKKMTALEEAMYEQFNDEDHGFGREAMHQEFERSRVFRPRFIVYGEHGMGQGYLASSILHYLEGVHVQNFDLPSLLADGRPIEQVIVGLFTEVRRHKPSVIYIPNVDAWYGMLRDMYPLALITFTTMLRSIPPTDPVLVFATAECERAQLPLDLQRDLFGLTKKNRMMINRPSEEHRKQYFGSTLDHIKKRPGDFPDPENRRKRVLEELPVAPKEEPKPPTKAELKAVQKRDHQLLNGLKIQLQPIMDQINRKYKKFRTAVIPPHLIEYLFAEADPNYIRGDVVEIRPYEIVKDKFDNDVLRDTTTGKCYYNLETTTIEERLSNGFYTRPKDFLFDIRALARDAKNYGDKERTLKANELLSNVEVDVASIENSTAHIDWEALFVRQTQRTKEQAEKERKKKAMQSIVDRVQSDLGGVDSDSGPVTLGEPVPGRTMARFQVKSPPPNAEQQDSHPLSNGTSNPSGGDVQMSGVDDETQPGSEMGPPPKSQNRSQAGMTQISQKSAVTSLPPGVSPSAVVNEASTTKTSDPSTHRSSNWSTQLTNGNHGEQNTAGAASQDNDVDIPDTAPLPSQLEAPSQLTSSDEAWVHSQAHALRANHDESNLSGSPTSSSINPRTPAKNGMGIGSILNDAHGDETHASRNSGSSASQPGGIESAVDNFLNTVTAGTEDMTIEQLEQLNRELMDVIWRERGVWNRHNVLTTVTATFNMTMTDIMGSQVDMSQPQEEYGA